MLKTIRQTLWALRHPILVLSSFTLLTVLSFLPSVQMFLIAAITNSLSAGDAHTALTWAGVTGGVLAGNLALQQVSNSLDMSLRAGMAQTGIRAIARRLASLTPKRPGCGRQRPPAHPSNQHRSTSLHVSYGGFALRHGSSRQLCGSGMPSTLPDSGGVRSGTVHTAQRAGLG